MSKVGFRLSVGARARAHTHTHTQIFLCDSIIIKIVCSMYSDVVRWHDSERGPKVRDVYSCSRYRLARLRRIPQGRTGSGRNCFVFAIVPFVQERLSVTTKTFEAGWLSACVI